MSKDIRSALTENLNELMKIKGIKAVDLADKVGVSKSAVSHWLAGDNAWYMHPLERQVYKQFEPFIKKYRSESTSL